MFQLNPGNLSSISYLAMVMIFRDFIQLLSITIRSLDFHISFPMKFTYASLTDWISFNFSFTVGIPPQLILSLQMIPMVICTLYLFILTIKEIRAKYQGLQASVFAEKSKFWQWMARGTIAIITTVTVPMISTTFQYFAGTLEGYKQSDYMSFLGVISIALCIVINPLLFYFGIKNTRPKPNLFSKDGGKHEDERSLYYKQLKSFHNPFKEIYSQFCHKGAYFNLLTMAFKFIRLAILVKPPNRKDGVGFIIAFVLDYTINGLYHWYLVKVQPFHSYQENRCQILGSANNIICIFLNMIILITDVGEEQQKGSAVRWIISILQLLSSLLIFQVYYFKVLLQYQPHCRRFFKRLFKELTFLPVTSRGVFGIKGAKNRYSNYILFNEEVYNKYEEAKMRIWGPFWRKLVSTEPDLKSPVKADLLPFITIGEAPPFLKNFQGSVEERLEENQRIIQLIGMEQYEIEVKKYEDPSFQQLVQNIYDSVPPVDAVFKVEGAQTEGFCKCTIFPFPFTVQLAFDGSNRIQFLRDQDDLQTLIKQNKLPRTLELRKFRLQIRSLRDQDVYHRVIVRTSRTKTKYVDGKTSVVRVPAKVTYTYGKLWVQPEVSSMAEFRDGTIIDLGKGLKVELRYSSGDGVDDDGDFFQGGAHTLSQKSLELDLWGNETTVLKQIVNNNEDVWKKQYPQIVHSINGYVKDINTTFNEKFSVLSYGFSSRLISCEYELFSDQEKIQALLNNEINPKMKSVMKDYKDQFKELYKQLEKVEENDFNFFLLCFFQEVWDLNQDLPMVKKNLDLLNYNKTDTCLMYTKRESINDWKAALLERRLRTKRGGGYFNDKLFRNLQKALNRFNDKPENFVNLDDIMSHVSRNKVAHKAIEKNADDLELQDLEKNNLDENATRVKLEDPPNSQEGNIVRSLSKEQTRLDNRLIQLESKISVDDQEKEKEPNDEKEINLN